MENLKKTVIRILDVIELHIPAVLFTAVFVMYIVIILYRYIFNKSVYELNELCQVFYISSAMLAASYAGRTDSHVYFPLLYDSVREKTKKIFRITSNIIVIALCCLIYKPTWEAAIWMSRKKTEVLDISFFYLYFVFIVFLTLSTIYASYHLIKEFKNDADNNGT